MVPQEYINVSIHQFNVLASQEEYEEKLTISQYKEKRRVYILINVCTVDGPGAHLPFILRLQIKINYKIKKPISVNII